MNDDTVIIELLTRIQSLEEKVDKLEKQISCESLVAEESQTTTAEIRNYIIKLKQEAASQGKGYIVLTAREIHGSLKLKSRYPMVCNAMRQVMEIQDEIVYSPHSGYSSTLEIKYYLNEIYTANQKKNLNLSISN